MSHVAPSASSMPAPRRVPEPFLRAEIMAFPLASEASFRTGLIELDPRLGEGNKTGQLWRACEARFAPHTGWSVDRMVAARDRGWFDRPPSGGLQPIQMHDYLRTLARSHLVARPGVTQVEESTDLVALDAANHYRWLTLTLPEDLLLAALGPEPAPLRVDLSPPLLVRRLLDLGVAEIHQHVGGGMDFPLLWASALAALATPDIREDALASPGAPLSEGRKLIRWLLAAAVARSVLAEHLLRGGDSLNAFLNNTIFCPEEPPAKHKAIHEGEQASGGSPTDGSRNGGAKPSKSDDSAPCKVNLAWTPRRRETLLWALTALMAGDDARLPDIEPLRDLYAEIHPAALTLRDHPLNGVEEAYLRCDPIAVRLALQGENAGERWFLRNALAYLEGKHHTSGVQPLAGRPQHDECFARLFWQVVRIRCQYYRTVVQRPLTGGLQWFIRFYDRIGPLRQPLDPILPQISYRVAGERHRIRALEFRTRPRDTPIEIAEDVLGYLRSWRQVLKENAGALFEPEMGIVFHFVKERDEGRWKKKGTPGAFWAETFAEPNREGGMDVAHGRYVTYFAAQCRKARALANLIKAVPSCLWVIRGLDVATDELGVPTWVLAPLFRHVLDTSAEASVFEDGLAPLNVTAHVGEDFRHLLEGMRRIYEQVHYILGGTKGRLGHAVALGVEPRSWAESVGSILMPAEERLWDLVWEWRLYTKYRIRPEYAAVAPDGRIETLLNEIRALSDHLYAKHAYRVEELAEAHHALHRFLVPPYAPRPEVDGGYDTFRNAVRRIARSGEHGHIRSPRRVAKILDAYLEDEYVFRKGQALIDVPIRQDEVEALDAIQDAMRRGIGSHGIVVEVNPSSNLLIGDLLDLRNHPILRLNPPLPEPDGPPPVAIAVGSDDPLTFSTELLHEYVMLHQAACAAGYPERVVHEWLESIRRTGMDARFTLAWRPRAKVKVNKLIRAMCEYLHEPY